MPLPSLIYKTNRLNVRLGTLLEPVGVLTLFRTLTGTSGDFVQFAGAMHARGLVSSTDSNGEPTCITDWKTTLSSIVTYTGRIQSAFDGTGVATLLDLEDYFPGEGAFQQCSTIVQGPPPIALRAADTMVIPILTTFRSSTTATQASTTFSASARPASSSMSVTPASTSESRTIVTDVSTRAAESGGPTASSSPARTTTGSQDVEQATSSSDDATAVSSQDASTEKNVDSSSVSIPVIPATLADDDATETTTDSTNNPPATNTGPSKFIETLSSGEHTILTSVISGVTYQDDKSSPGTTINADDQTSARSETILSVLPSNSGTRAIVNGRTSTLPLPTGVVGMDDNFVSRIPPITQAYTLNGPTISKGGEAVIVSGTSYSALPSDLGIVAVDDSGSTTTIRGPQLGTHGISTMSDRPDVYVLPEQTLVRDGPAIVISGATYSPLPHGGGINVATSGQTSSITITEPTNVPGIGGVGVAKGDKSIDGYVFDGSVTVIAGGAAATTSNTVYSALPSGFGVLVAGGCGSDDVLASYIAQGVGGNGVGESGNGDHSCIIGASSLLGVEGSEATVSGVVYSALPSEAGVLVVASGESKTIALASIVGGTSGGQGGATATNDSIDTGTEHSAAVYTGAASPVTIDLAGSWHPAFFGMVAVVSAVW